MRLTTFAVTTVAASPHSTHRTATTTATTAANILPFPDHHPPYSLLPTPYSLLPTPCSLLPAPLLPAPSSYAPPSAGSPIACTSQRASHSQRCQAFSPAQRGARYHMLEHRTTTHDNVRQHTINRRWFLGSCSLSLRCQSLLSSFFCLVSSPSHLSSLLRTVKARVGLFSLENSIFQSFVGELITDPSMTTRGGESYLARE